jgi:gamma-glutamyl:cysteine ligase YbdK (ATP-grasp superfamily)
MTHARFSCLGLVAALFAVISAAATTGCNRPSAVLTELVEARRLASELHVQFAQAVDASNRAVMADKDEVSATAAGEARRARDVVERDAQKLRPIVESLGFRDDLKHLEEFNASFDEYRRLDDEILSLAIESTNLKAQHRPRRLNSTLPAPPWRAS